LKIGTVLLLLAPLSAGFGLWLNFKVGILVGSNTVGMITVAETRVGVFFFSLGFPLFFLSLGIFASRNYLEAEKWLLCDHVLGVVLFTTASSIVCATNDVLL
jgi:hypothetical protein